MTTTLSIIRNRPVAKFRYQGSHRNPVRRTVLLTSVSKDLLTGYEVREGNQTRSLEDQVIKSYNRDEILELERLPMSVCS